MSLGIYYILSNAVIPRWRRMLAFQRSILPGWESVPKLFVLDRSCQEQVPGEVLKLDLFRDGLILFSQAKNVGLAWAERNNFEWVLDCDVDTAVARLPTYFPPTGYGSMLCYFPDGPIGDEEIRLQLGLGDKIQQASSRFLIHKNIFSKYRFDEGFVGYGGEDTDYNENVLGRSGILNSPTDARGVHLWHFTSKEIRMGNYDRFEMRKAVTKAMTVDGWMAEAELEWLSENAANAKRIVEIGSWKGRSTQAIVGSTQGKVIAIDHWEGSTDQHDATTVEVKKRGADSIFNEFCSHFTEEIASEKLMIVRANVPDAIPHVKRVFPEGADFIFIDGDHTYEAVHRDLGVALQLLAPGGLLCGHDLCPPFPGVQKALDELVKKYTHAAGSIWRTL